MQNDALLNLYLEKLRTMTKKRLDEKDISILDALKESILFIEGEMTGY